MRQQRPLVVPADLDAGYRSALDRIRADIRAGTLTELAVSRTRARYGLTEQDVQRARRRVVAEGLATIKGRRCVAVPPGTKKRRPSGASGPQPRRIA